MKYKALALDLDGTTLVGEDLPEANRLALQRAADAGLEIIMATARWVHMVERVSDEIGVKSVAIACSGAQVHDMHNGEDIMDLRLPADFVHDLYDICNHNRCIATVTVTDDVWLKLDGKPDQSQMGDEMTWVPELKLDEENLPRIAAIQGTAVCEAIKNELHPKYVESVHLFDSIGPTGRLVITLTAEGATKGTALIAACQHLGINTREVVAFGDAENDLEMFKLAGASVAMGQADDEVKAAADYVSKANYEDGVAYALEQLLESGELPS